MSRNRKDDGAESSSAPPPMILIFFEEFVFQLLYPLSICIDRVGGKIQYFMNFLHTIIEEPKVAESVSQHNAHNALNGILDGVRSVAGKVAKFSEEHPTLTKIFKIGSALVIAGASTYVAHEHSSRSKNATNNDETTDGSNDDSFELENSYEIDTELETNIDTNPDVPSDETVERNYPDTHASPKEHIVPAGGQHYHTKDGIVWREKEAYRRGGKNEDDE